MVTFVDWEEETEVTVEENFGPRVMGIPTHFFLSLSIVMFRGHLHVTVRWPSLLASKQRWLHPLLLPAHGLAPENEIKQK